LHWRQDRERARRYAQLADHYSALAAEQEDRAAKIRLNRRRIAAFLAAPASAGDEPADPLLREMATLRMAFADRMAAATEALDSADRGFRLEVVRYLARAHEAEKLLLAARHSDPAVRQLATAFLDAALRDRDLVAINRMIAILP